MFFFLTCICLQIGELAMIPSKDAKELLYKLFAERFIALQVVSDTQWLGLTHVF